MKFKKFNFKKVKSTNDTAIRIIKNTNFKFGMVISDTQLSGKGQYGAHPSLESVTANFRMKLTRIGVL